MQIKAVLFDLDGTLLPMDQDKFVEVYFGLLAKRLAPHGYEPKALIHAIGMGIRAMVQNDGSKRNEEAFWDAF
ncbi:MAG: HAD family hydrolase, partial [Butyricicoccus sp.]|nr:HAD family hydrolase [Butyricicoccus sp.]